MIFQGAFKDSSSKNYARKFKFSMHEFLLFKFHDFGFSLILIDLTVLFIRSTFLLLYN